jgi:hypothetical protein
MYGVICAMYAVIYAMYGVIHLMYGAEEGKFGDAQALAKALNLGDRHFDIAVEGCEGWHGLF